MEALTTERLAWTVGDRLTKARTTAGISVEAMASELGVSRTTISNYEHGRTHPSRSVLRVWAEVCDAPLEWLAPQDGRSVRYALDGLGMPQSVAVAA